MKMSLFFKKLMVLIISVFMFLGSINTHSIQVNAEESEEDTVRSSDGITWEKVDSSEIDGMKPARDVTEDQLTEAGLIKDGNVRVTILVDGESTIDAGYSAQGIAENSGALAYRTKLLNNQRALAQKITKEALNGESLDVVWNFTLAGNMMSANVPYIKIERIKRVAGVKDVVIENQYLAADPVVSADPNMAIATGMTGTNLVLSDYTGAGQAVAIIDTGLDTDHRSFDPDAFDYALAQIDKDVDLIEKREVTALLSQLNASQKMSSVKPGDVYLSTKVPFAFNYVDNDLDVTHDNDAQGEHGSHVAGIAAANRFVEKDGKYVSALDEVKTQGQAPDAQIIVMKVFGKGGGAYDSDYFAAIEDAMVLGAASANLSLGSSVAGMATDDTYAEQLKRFTEEDTVVVTSGGNNYNWSEPAATQGKLYAEDSNYATGGNPGSFTNSFTVASIDNNGNTGIPIIVGGENVYFDDAAGARNVPLTTMSGEQSYIAVDGFGEEEDMQALAPVLKDKIAVVSRGEINFSAKANNAVANGASAVLVYNNTSGTISMTLADNEGNPAYYYTNPVASITQYAGELMKKNGEKKEEGGVTYYEGTLTITKEVTVSFDDAEYLTMSEFSSWGCTGDLNLKPEITAPGGNIYSVNGKVAGGQAYEVMSGTSMAAPEVAGLTALAHQYIEENDLVAKTGLSERQLTLSLMMSTAQPVLKAEDQYYSVMKQGAGLANIAEMTKASSYVLVQGTEVNGKAIDREAYTASYADGKVKAILGDDPDRTGKYTVTYTLTNFSDEAVAFEFDADFFTQAIDEEAGYRLMDTAPLAAAVTYTVDGKPIEASDEDLSGCDFNEDGYINAYDAVALLEYVVGTREAIANEEGADLDEDGDVDTYDAYLALDQLSTASAAADPGETITVTASIDLNGSLDTLGSEKYNGNYVEGFLYANEAPTDEGAEGVSHSIPVFGYFGNWSEPESTDKGSVIAYAYEEEDRDPYLTAAMGKDAKNQEYFAVTTALTKQTIAFGGNPYVWDEEYHPERNAINGKDTVSGFSYTQIRNAGARKFTVENENGETLYELLDGPAYAAYYYRNESEWRNYKNIFRTSYKPADVEEGTKLSFNYTMAPEYYVVDGEVDWDALDENATVSIDAVVDNTAPELVGEDAVAFVYDPEDETAVIGLDMTVSDNQYIALTALYDEDGELIDFIFADEEAEAGETNTYSFAIDEDYPAHLFVLMADYAMNQTVYRINLDESELDDDVTVTVSPENALVILGNTTVLSADVRPWGIDTSVTWSSEDESIATVDENGIVTGVAVGETKIKATSVLDPEASATATVTVKSVDIPLNGIVWDENGEVWFSEFNAGKLPNYQKLHDTSLRLPIASAAYDENGTLYAASFDSDNWLSNLYIVDEETYEMTLVGGSDVISYMDICKAPSLGGDYMLAVYGRYVIVFSKTTGDYVGFFDLSKYTNNSYLVGIAYQQQFYIPYYDTDSDWVYLVDETGNLYEFGVIMLDGAIRNFAPELIGQIGDSVDTTYFQSLYFDGSNVFWSRFNEADNNVELIMVEDIAKTGSIYELGYFDDGVWPVGGIYEKGVADVGQPTTASSDKAGLKIEAAMEQNIERITPRNKVSKGSLNTVSDSDEEETVPGNAAVTDASVTITTDSEDTNALYTIEYDPEALELISADGLTKYNAVNTAEEGQVKVGFISEEALAEGTDVAKLTFNLLDPEAQTEVVITTSEENDEHPETAETFVFGYEKGVISEVVYNDPTWEWSEDGSLAVATFVSEDGEVETKVNAAADGKITEEIVKEATCEEDGEATYTAEITVDFKTVSGETTFKDVKTVTLEATGHAWGEWVLDSKNNRYVRTCENDPSHTEVEEGKVLRIFGNTRYETSIKLADLLKEQLEVDEFEAVVVAAGGNFADALSGAYLANKNNAPILITNEAGDEAVKDYIKANLKEGGKIYILGGPAAVSETFEDGLDGYEVKRLAGETRYETNIAILEEAGVEDEEVIVATGVNYADSLSASAVNKPILLVNHTLTDTHRAFLKDAKVKKFYVVGGTMAVSSRVDTQLGAYGEAERLAGEDRFETSKMVADKFIEDPETVVLVYSHNFPDGLCGGPVASAINAPILLTCDDAYENSADYVSENSIITGFVIGGESLISDETTVDVFSLKSSADILVR